MIRYRLQTLCSPLSIYYLCLEELDVNEAVQTGSELILKLCLMGHLHGFELVFMMKTSFPLQHCVG